MGAAIAALRDTFSMLRRDTRPLLEAATLSGVGGYLASLSLLLVPPVGPIVNNVFVAPGFVGGLLARIDDCRSRTASVAPYSEGFKRTWAQVSSAYAIANGLFIALFIVALLVTTRLTSTETVTDRVEDGLWTLVEHPPAEFLAYFLLLFVPVAFVVAMAVQFVDVSIVVKGTSIFASFVESWHLAIARPFSTLVYTCIRVALFAGVYAVPLVLFDAVGASLVGSPFAALVLALLACLVVTPIALLLGYTYHAAYYVNRVQDLDSNRTAVIHDRLRIESIARYLER
jgi:hypothetical protein